MDQVILSYANDSDGDFPGDRPATSSSTAGDFSEREAHPDRFCECTLRKDSERDQWHNGRWRRYCHRCRAGKQIQDRKLHDSLTQTPSSGLGSQTLNYSKPLPAQSPLSIARMSIVSPVSWHNREGSPVQSDSREQQGLLDFLECEPSPELILQKLLHYHKEGRDLAWLQDIIPELRPGVESNAEWVQSARNKLWGPDVRAQHKELCGREELLNQTLPDLPAKDYGLRRYWSTIIETLRPVSLAMAPVVDRVSIAIGRSGCVLLTPGGTWTETPIERNPSKHTFLVIRQVLQDKILSPLIDTITTEFRQRNDHETGESARSIDSKRTQSSRWTVELREALQDLRSVVVEEKDKCDSSKAERFEEGEPTTTTRNECWEAYGTAKKRTGSSTRGIAEIKKARMDI